MLKDVVIRGFIACRRETNASNIRKSGWYQWTRYSISSTFQTPRHCILKDDPGTCEPSHTPPLPNQNKQMMERQTFTIVWHP
jgi:hypothetical protein